MKKKILFMITAMSFLIAFPNYINARSIDACSLEDSKAVLKLDTVASANLGTRFSHIFSGHANTTYFAMTLDGYKSMCISPGFAARSGDKYEYAGVATNPNHINGFAFYRNDGNYKGSSQIKWAISQLVVWEGINIEKIAELLKNDYTLKDEETRRRYTDAERLAYAYELAGIIRGSSGNFLIWRNTTRAGQDLITTLEGCKETQEETAVCPLGTMVKTNPGMSCIPKKGGVNVEGFSYTATGGTRADVHVEYGEERALAGNAYCRVYCEESGAATMPGAFGETLQIGSYMIWPTSESNSSSKFYKNAYPLKFEGKLTCKIGILPDENMPYSCKKDPIEEYSTLYNYLKKRYKNSTYQRKSVVGTLEKMREKITTSVTEAPNKKTYEAWCTSAYDNASWASSYDYKYSRAKELMNEAAKKYSAAMKAVNDYTGEKEYPCGPNDSQKCVIPAYKALLDAEAAAKKVYDAKKAIVDAIEEGIENCTNYTYNFELARQILLTYKECAEYNASSDLYDFSSSASFNYKDEEYDVGNIYPEKNSTSTEGEMSGNKGLIDDSYKTAGLKFEELKKQENKNVGELTNIVNTIKTREFSIYKSDTYMLETDYKYLDKDKLKYKKNNSGLSNYISFDNTVIPTSYKNEIGKEYWLTISNIKFGMAGFGSDELGNGTTYACPVQFTKTRTPDTCICPEGTENAGKDLTCYIKDSNTTCEDAKVQYCNNSSIEIPEECGGDLYCDAPMDNISIGSCINSGGTRASCIQQFCPGADDIECPNTNNVDDPTMNDRLRDCVAVKINQGISRADAIKACEQLVCPYKNGKRIIYRTIRLENPFPSMNADATVTQKNLKIGMFNNTIKGRYPGSNWNGVTLVSKKIRNNREISGTSIYQKKEPLYTFVLNRVTIQRIRDYNDKQKEGYNDFKLDCKINNSAACVSYFVHNTAYGLASGDCYKNTSKNDFYKCASR